MTKKSSGILLYRFENDKLQVLLAHPGGPFWAKKNYGAWTIPKGEFGEEEEPLESALRELEEETGIKASGNFIPLTPIKQKSGKLIYAFGHGRDADTSKFRSNTFEIEWPPRSGKMQSFPEVDKIEWFDLEEAGKRIIPGQAGFLYELETLIR